MALTQQIKNKASKIINRAEKALGKLSDGQKRDLLKDNTNWSSATVAEVVAYLTGKLKNPLVRSASGWIKAKAVKIVNGKLLIKR